MRLIDSHCHLEPYDFPNPDEAVQRAKDAGVVHGVVIGQFHKPGDYGSAIEVAKKFPDFFSPTMGIHPHDAAKATEADFDAIAEMCRQEVVKAVGEAGLDYYYDRSPRETQQTVFRRQIQLAKSLKKPLVVHVRDAHPDCISIIRDEGIRHGVIHCFTGEVAEARRYLDLGFYISISGVVTFKKSEALREAVAFTPIDRLLVETDSPYLAPVPHRGKQNEPAWVKEVALKVAEVKSVSVEQVADETTANAIRLFALNMST